ncbi:Zn(II)2Cys6 transcription factor [Aspergillus stella-maris]|uniref:Zn(II)2Cys6 transcription factor n=1 Tax=Aspergillus stella-maris TaxID=1810926 RepID=UPI003CCCDF3A
MNRRKINPGRSCLECRRRKIKCDRSHPCSYCVKVRVNCKYPPGRQKHDDNSTDLIASLEGKLKALEDRLSEKEGSFDHGPPVPAPAPLAAQGDENRQQVEGESRAPLTKTSMAALNTTITGTRAASLLLPQPAIDLNSLRPSPLMMALLWEKYLENVDPVIKIFHTPSAQKLVMQAIRGQKSLDLPSDCLLFAIYYATVASMSPADCKREFEAGRGVLLKQCVTLYTLLPIHEILTYFRYRTGVEYLLSHLHLRGSTSMTVLQAFTIYLITGRCDLNGPDVYALVGLAVGMALKMGLNQDGESLGQPPFETEMRRRLWWQLLILDMRMAEDRQSEPCILESSFNTRLPSNIADTNLHPDMSRPPVCSQDRTEMLYSLVRFEISYFARQMVFSDGFGDANAYATLSSDQKCEAIKLFEQRIEHQYLSNCDEIIPLDRVTTGSARLILAKLKLMATDRIAIDDVPPGQRAMSRKKWISILQDAKNLRGYEAGNHWLWLFQTYIEWDALAYLLLHLRADPIGDEDDQGWDTAYRVYSFWKTYELAQRDRRWKQIEELRLEVLARRKRPPIEHSYSFQGTSDWDMDSQERSGGESFACHDPKLPTGLKATRDV